MPYSKITGTGSYLPEKILTNKDMEELVDTTDEWIRERTGIRQRHIAADDETTCDLAASAALRAIEMAGKSHSEIDLIILATTTADKIFPGTACLLQKRLDVHGCPAFDVQAVCTGFVYALGIADKFIRAGEAKCALIVGSETLSRILDWNDRSTCVLFGDGAGAVVLEASDEPGILSTHLHADGSYEHLLHVPHGISSGYEQPQGRGSVRLHGRQCRVQDGGEQAGRDRGRGPGGQPDRQGGPGLAGAAPGEPPDHRGHGAKAENVHGARRADGLEHGNTSAASIPLALDTAVRDGRIKKGETLMLEAFGSGFTWGSALLQF